MTCSRPFVSRSHVRKPMHAWCRRLQFTTRHPRVANMRAWSAVTSIRLEESPAVFSDSCVLRQGASVSALRQRRNSDTCSGQIVLASDFGLSSHSIYPMFLRVRGACRSMPRFWVARVGSAATSVPTGLPARFAPAAVPEDTTSSRCEQHVVSVCVRRALRGS
jgi:hypothetical protein